MAIVHNLEFANEPLRCRVPGCRTKIRAMTGLQELQKLGKHMERVHLVSYDTRQLLELRARWETAQDAERKKAR